MGKMNKKLRSIAIHLPQFHPISENDKWWGKGFTEWRNVAKARPLFEGHYQPHMPSDLGFYDLRLPEARQAQADLAKQYGIDGFCYYHYWFNGKRVLERPVNEILKCGEPDFPFMLCWANENWTRRWDGQENDVLLRQNYSSFDDEKHMEYLVEIFKDARYIRIDNKPVIAIYKSFLLPEPQKTADTWRAVAARHGLELYICNMAFSYAPNTKKEESFDAAIDFEPFGVRHPKDVFSEVADRTAARYIKQNFLQRFLRKLSLINPVQHGSTLYNTIEYEYCYSSLANLKDIGYKLFPAVTPGWDNTARKSTNPSLVLQGSTPEKFKTWVSKVVNDFEPYSREENLVFVNAWNEWAEGNHLEPCLKWGHAYLEAFKQGMKSAEHS